MCLFPKLRPSGSQVLIIRLEVLRRDRHNDRGVRVVCHPVEVAHAVDRQSSGLAGCVYDKSARAHTERVHAAPVAACVRELVVGARQQLCGVPVLRTVDPLPLVLHAHAHGKCLRLHRKAALIQPLHGVPRRVSDRQHGDLRIDGHASGLSRAMHCSEASFLYGKAGDGGVCHHRSAQFLNLLLHPRHDRAKPVRADMRLVSVQDLLRRSELNKSPQNIVAASVAILDQSI